MKLRTDLMFSIVCVAALLVSGNVLAYSGKLSPQNFNKMYYLATKGKVGVLRSAINRGLNIDATNPNGDTGLCIAVKRKDYVAYNTFRMSGANPRHRCTYKMYKEYQEFLDTRQAASADKIIGNEESLYYQDDEKSWWPWILGGAAVGGGVLALTSGGGGGKPQPLPGGDDTIIPTDPGYGLTALVDNYRKLYGNGNVSNTLKLNASNPNAAAVVNNIKFLPNMLDNVNYLQAYIKVINGAYFNNMFGGGLMLGDAAIGAAAYGRGSTASNNGIVEINARNGSIGLAASNGATVYNNSDRSLDNTNGSINMTFTGNREGDTVIGMYADTGSRAINFGTITGTTSYAEVDSSETKDNTDIGDIFIDDESGDGDKATSTNSGTMLGMALFDFYTGTNNSGTSVRADNYGNIVLSAGSNNATDASVSLIGMGSYIDDKFLNGNSNPAYAEKMFLHNYGNIKLSYQGNYTLSDRALKLGDGGLIGMRADASTFAQNTGKIEIDLQNAVVGNNNLDVAAGMLSVHGAELVNGTIGFNYDGATAVTGGTIRVVNQARAGGVTYGMLAAKGDGSQTRVYNWSQPKLYNYGLIDMQVSNAFGMASFAGGEIVNKGVINLGVEKGQSYYTNNYGLYAAGDSVSDEVSLINDGIINVYSEQSTAIYNAFAGSVSLQNNGSIYISNKATDSKVFGGNFSEAVNNGTVIYKVGNSAGISFPDGASSSIGYNIQTTPVASVMQASSNSDTTKQYVANKGTIIIGAARSEADYGGTYGTAGIQVSKQGSADNDNVIRLDIYDRDTRQLNVGMWLDSTATAESYINNKGTITVNATNSTAMRNDSLSGAQASNLGTIWLNGLNGHGMSVTSKQGMIFNGRYGNANKPDIHVKGNGSVGMYVKDGTAYNYGTISLEGDNTTAFQISGKDAVIAEKGNITHQNGLKDATYFWVNDSAVINLDYDNPLTVDGYTLGKATNKGEAHFVSTAYVSGNNSHLLVADVGGKAYNEGTVYAQNGTSAIKAKNKGEAYNQGMLTVSGSDTIGMHGEGTGTLLSADGKSVINVVEGGTGVRVEDKATIENSGVINVSGGTGIYLTDGSSTDYTQGMNLGNINVSGINNKGVVVVNGAHFDNAGGNVTASGGAYGIYSTADVTNSGTVASNNGGIGIYAAGGNVTNNNDIVVNGASSYGIYNTGAVVKNNGGTITVNSGVGVYGSLENVGNINVYSDGIGVEGNIKSSGTINVYGSAIGVKGSGINMGTITNNGVGAGVVVTGSFTNSGTIEGNTLGVKVDGGIFNNADKITIASGTGVYVVNGSAVNQGEITVGSGKGIHVDGASSNATNYGTIEMLGEGYGAYVTNSGTFVNNGTIKFDSQKGNCANIGVGGNCEDAQDKNNRSKALSSAPIFVGDNAEFVNKGDLDLGNRDIDFNALREDKGSFVVASGGTYIADSFKGDVVAGKDIVMGGFDDIYTNENSFAGRNEGLGIISESYMFDASLKEKDDTVDVELNRKSFEDLVEEKDLVAFFETNYGLHNNEKMFNALKNAEDKKAFDSTVELESGKPFYANLQRENMAVLRGLNMQEQNRIFEDGLQGRFAGADYYRTGKDASGGLSGYTDDVYSAYFGYGGKLNQNWSVAGTLRAAYADADYDEARSSRENKILMAFLPIMYQNGNMKFLTMPEVGVGYGSYKRKAVSGSYDADTLDLYYGLYNHAEYSIDMKVVELVAEAELNLQGSSMSKAKEGDGLNLHANNSLSLESGVGVKLRKRFELAKQRSLMLAVGVKYYHEFLDPYKDLTVGMNGSPVHYNVNGYDENKDRIRTSAEAVYKDGDFSVAAEIAHNAEKESSVEGGLGVRYNF